MPKTAREITKALEIEARRGKDFTVGGIPGLKCDYREAAPCYYLQWTQNGRRQRFYIGTVTLKEAKIQARLLREEIDRGTDPKKLRIEQQEAERREAEQLQKERDKAAHTLANVSAECFAEYRTKGVWNGKDKGQHEIDRFNRRVLPDLGELPITEITPHILYEHFKNYWVTKGNTADKVHNRLNLVFNWAVAKGTYGLEVNPADKKGPFGVMIDPLTKAREKDGHSPAPDYRRVPELLRECLTEHSTSARACVFQILTAMRGKAVRTLQWSDIDFSRATATIRPENDKGSKEFKTANRPREVYLSKQAMALLNELPRLGDYVFISREGFNKPLGNCAIAQFLKGIHEKKEALDGTGWVDINELDEDGHPRRIAPHGTARATFRTWAEENDINDKAAELCLLHLTTDIYKGAYKRGTMEQERRRIMQMWADFCLPSS